MAEGIGSHVHCGPSKNKTKRKTAQTCNYSNKTTPKRELGERVGKSETKEKSKEGEKLVGGKRGWGKSKR